MAKIKIYKEEDRLAVAAILIKNGYTVRQGREKRGNTKSYDYFVEYHEPKVKEGEPCEG